MGMEPGTLSIPMIGMPSAAAAQAASILGGVTAVDRLKSARLAAKPGDIQRGSQCLLLFGGQGALEQPNGLAPPGQPRPHDLRRTAAGVDQPADELVAEAGNHQTGLVRCVAEP